MPELKVCGVTDAAFACAAARRGVDYLGFIFAEGSPRRVTVEQALEIADAVSELPTVRLVGVFVSHAPSEIAAIASHVGLDVVQLHGDYGADEVSELKTADYEVWALGGSAASDSADAVLLDGQIGEQRGGTGRLADWSLVTRLKRAGRRIVLAGGISAENISAAVATGADVIDVNSSLETSPGVKSVEKLDSLLGKFVLPER